MTALSITIEILVVALSLAKAVRDTARFSEGKE